MSIPANERRVILAYQGNAARIRRSVERHLRATWAGMRAYRDSDIDRMVARVVPVVQGGQRQIAAVTSAYLAAVSAASLGTPRRPVAAGRVSDLRGVPSTEVYRRPGVTVWTALAAGKPPPAAIRDGGRRLLSLAAMDLQMAKTHAARTVIAADAQAVGYQRVITGTCSLCVLTSTERYGIGDLLPIHPGCQCDIRPLYGAGEPSQVVDPILLASLHEAASEFTDDEADPQAVVVRDHGEYGPTLTWLGQNFTGPADI